MLLFDIDGTLLYTGGAGKEAFNRAFTHLFGVPKSWGQIRADGKTDPVLIQEVAQNAVQRSLTPEEAESIRKLYVQYFKEELPNSDRFRVMPGAFSLLSRLASDPRFLLGLATGNYEETSYLKLKRAGLDSFFKFGGFGCDSDKRHEIVKAAIQRGERLIKQSIPLASVCVIGDTIHDVLSGKMNGTKTMGVLTGKTSQQEFHDAGTDKIVSDFSDADALIQYWAAPI